MCAASETILTGTVPMRDHLARYVSEAEGPLRPEPRGGFRLTGFGVAEALYDTGLGAMNHPEDIAALGLVHRCTGDFSFARFAVRS
jgi:hypothetical protein